jgi:endogenous inhibitor of DNA gyrase (YacG/DUF329 family)
MLKTKTYSFECLVCKNPCVAKRSINAPEPKFCSKKCYQAESPKWLKHKEFRLKSDQEKADHLNLYYEKNVIKKDGCWDWRTKVRQGEYPRMNHARSEPRISINRYAWTVNFGEIPEGLYVCHKCDNKRCSNPEHLFLGTHSDNTKDLIDKGRQVRGSTHGMSKLNENKVREIRRFLSLGVTMARLGKDYGVDLTTIDKIKRRITWKHIN